MIHSRVLARYILVGIVLLTSLVYWTGLKGGFLFDDQSNLGGLGYYAQSGQWPDAKKFITSGFAGPTGRPIALATFIPQAYAWPVDAYPFKLANLCIHLLCGVLLYCATRLLLLSYGYKEEKAVWVALLSSSFWMLHPLFVSTTLYVIQRMAQLPLLFSLLGIIGYLKGRALLISRPTFAYVTMMLSIGIATVLATYSKENGALLPLLILIIEFCNPSNINKPIWYWRAVCLWLPSLAIIAFFIYSIDLSENPWPYRSFNQIERLWSEGRIVSDYLYHLFAPQIEGYGLFQDGYVISRGWFDPLTTFISIIFLTVLFVSAFALRKTYPLFSLAILFFFAAHLMESTVIGLELYFEHRNYVAAIFLFLPVAAGIYELSEKTQPKFAIIISCGLLLLLSLMTWQRAVLWSDSTKLQVYWAQKNPQSVRAQSRLAEILVQHGRVQEANRVLEQALVQRPDAGLLIQLIKQKIDIGQVSDQDFLHLQQQIIKQKPDGAAIWGMRGLIEKIVNNQHLTSLYAQFTIVLLNDLVAKNDSFKRYPNFYPLSFYLQAQLYTALKQPDQAYQAYRKAAIEYRDVSAALAMVVDLANRGYRKSALKLLAEVEVIYQKQLSPDSENDKIKNKLKQDIQKDLIAESRQNMSKDVK